MIGSVSVLKLKRFDIDKFVQKSGWRVGATYIRYFLPCFDASCDQDNSQPVKFLTNRWSTRTRKRVTMRVMAKRPGLLIAALMVRSATLGRSLELTHHISTFDVHNEKHMRYTNSWIDKQRRQISIKIVPMSLVLEDSNAKSYLYTVMDSLGHVNFSNEMTTTLALADGAMLVVDAAEGVMVRSRRKRMMRDCLSNSREEEIVASCEEVTQAEEIYSFPHMGVAMVDITLSDSVMIFLSQMGVAIVSAMLRDSMTWIFGKIYVRIPTDTERGGESVSNR
ncbi:hypothetical protein SUGI_1004310 [Cryptomeria japonica]|nr:hypothetical protein SUGI_1004310 [Cryptomeria japonica]